MLNATEIAAILNASIDGNGSISAVGTVAMLLGCGVSDAAVRVCKGSKSALVTGIRPSRFVKRAGALEGTAMIFVEVRGRLERFDVRVECYDGGRGGEWHACGRVSDGGPHGGRFV